MSTQHRRALAVLLLTLLAALGGGSAQAQSAPPPDLPAYEGLLREAYFAAGRGDRLGVEAVVPRLTDSAGVRLADGTVVPVDNRWLQEALADPQADLEPVAARLGALIDALAAPQSTSDPQALEQLKAILARPPFASEQPASEPGWLERFFQWLGDLLGGLFRPAGAAINSGGELLGWVLLALGTLAIVGLLAYAALSLRRGVVREAVAPGSDLEAGLTANLALQQAGETARSGDYRTAVRYLYLSSLLWLDEQGMLRYDRALTNREYLAQVRGNSSLHARLTPVVETFDRVWYGHTPIDSDTFESYRRQVDELRRAS